MDLQHKETLNAHTHLLVRACDCVRALSGLLFSGEHDQG